METALTFTLIVAILVPAVHLNPLPQENCTATDDDLIEIKSAIQKAANGKDLSDEILPKDTLERCPMLKTIAEKIKSAADEIIHLKESSVTVDQVDELKRSFEEKANEIIKSQDIFVKQANLKSTAKQGTMIDRMTTLQLKVSELEKEIVEKTQKMYEDIAELIFVRLKMNSTDQIRNYTKHMIEKKLDELIHKLETDPRVFLGALRFLDHWKDNNLIDKVYDGLLKRLNDTNVKDEKDLENGKHVVVSLLCWIDNNKYLWDKFWKRKYPVYEMVLKIYPWTKGNEEKTKADVRSRQHCISYTQFPANVAASFAHDYMSCASC